MITTTIFSYTACTGKRCYNTRENSLEAKKNGVSYEIIVTALSFNGDSYD